MTTQSDIHELTASEIARQIAAHNARRREIIAERAAIYRESARNPGIYETVVLNEDERAAREHAKTLLNGAAPASLVVPRAADISRDRELAREMRAIEIVLKVLGDKATEMRAAAAVEWAEANRDEWRRLAREIVLTAIRLSALHARACSLYEQCPDRFAVSLPASVAITSRYLIDEQTVGELREAALEENILVQGEIKKAMT